MENGTVQWSLPSYSDLPRGLSGAGSAWNLFSTGDEVGLINLQTEQNISRAMSLGSRGKVFSLSQPLDFFSPPLFPGRGIARHTVLQRSGYSLDDVLDNFFPQASSQWDGLGHVGVRDDVFYGGATTKDILNGRNSVARWADKGIVGRGIVLNMSGIEPPGIKYLNGSSPVITTDDLERVRTEVGVEFNVGDIIILYTGFGKWYSSLNEKSREDFVKGGVECLGLEHSEEMAEYLWNSHAMAVVSDNVAVEQWPPDYALNKYPFGLLHRVLIGEFGMALGELWFLDDLVADCEADGIFECCVMSAPMSINGGIGSMANALAIK